MEVYPRDLIELDKMFALDERDAQQLQQDHLAGISTKSVIYDLLSPSPTPKRGPSGKYHAWDPFQTTDAG